MRSVLLALSLALVLVSLGPGCGRSQDPTRAAQLTPCVALEADAPARPRDVVFILSDTLRRDRLGAYGGPARTPHFDRFAAQGLLFTAAVAPAPWTKPSVASLFTGLRPAAHGVVSHPELREREHRIESDVLAPEHVTLAEGLAAAGYRTAAFVSNPWLGRELGFAQGFELYDHSLAGNATPGERVSEAGLRWLRERPRDGRPYFLYLHYMDAHAPYHRVGDEALERARAQLASDDRPLGAHARRRISELALDAEGRPLVLRGLEPNLALMELVYDQGVEHFDRALGAFLEGFAALEGSSDAAIWVTADHGEALYARGFRGHGHALFEGEIGIPLAARLPDVTTRGAISCPVGLRDLRRSICDHVGAACPGGRGVSIFSAGFADPERVLVAEAVLGRPNNRAARDGRYKLVAEPDGRRAGSPLPGDHALYDLAQDPSERRNLLVEEASYAALSSFERLRRALGAPVPPLPSAPRVRLDDATRERLEALGYLER
jgi:arylsulfatase A-like enzyme